MRLEINQFGGTAPIIHPTALSEKLATYAHNVRFDTGVLSPGALRLMTTADYPDNQLGTVSGEKVVVKMFDDNTRFVFPDKDAINAFPSPITPQDEWGRVYFMGPNGPTFATTDQYVPSGLNTSVVGYRLGVPAPPIAVSVVVNYDTVPEGADRVDVSYAYSYVDKYGHEGPISPATNPVELYYDHVAPAALTFNDPTPANVNFQSGLRRVYRSVFDGQSAVWQYLMDVPITTTSTTDNFQVGSEGEMLVSGNWHPAPIGLKGLCLMAASYAAGYTGHYLCYSELKLPHAWPFEYQYPLKYEPVKLQPMDNGLFIATTGRPYWAEGTDPGSAVPREVPINAPCLAPESVVDMGGAAVYITEEGIVSVRGGQAEVISRAFIDRAGILELVDEDSTAFVFEDHYVFSTKDDRWMGFIPDSGFVEYSFGFAPDQFASVTFSVRDNRYYFAFNNGTVRVVDFNGTAQSPEWHSKHWRTPPGSFSLIRVEADVYPVQVKVRCQYLSEPWQEYGYFTVSDPHAQRLPVMTGGLWQVCIKPATGGNVFRAILAQSGQEAR